jgi:CRP/FNR family transcriptional regulator, anaerobic regulatory protein
MTQSVYPLEAPAGVASSLRLAFNDAPRVLERRLSMIRPGEPCGQVFLLASGWACRERRLPNGERAILDLYLPGDMIGLDHLFVQCALDSVSALTAISYYARDCQTLGGLMQRHSGMALQAMRHLAEEKGRLDRHATRLARLPAIERTAACLWHLCERLAAAGAGKAADRDQGTFKLPLTQQDWADYLGLNIIHLNRTFRTLRADGTLRPENGSVIVEDVARLRTAARTYPGQA